MWGPPSGGPTARTHVALVWALAACVLIAGCRRERDPGAMSFFVTSMSPGTGNLGGLAGADAHCRSLAQAAGSPKREWRAYLSAPAANGQPATNARDRIGTGPWVNAMGVQVAASVDELHTDNRLGTRNSLNEWGEIVHGSMHDILTGSQPDGTLASGESTCGGWTSTGGQAIVGHSNKTGGGAAPRPTSWNSAHQSYGCGARDLEAT